MAGGEIAVSAVQTTRREHVQTISWLTMSDQDPQAALDEFRRLVEGTRITVQRTKPYTLSTVVLKN